MSLYVLKFGGSSVATTDRIKHIASIVVGYIKKNHKIVVVTSARQGVTNQLIELSRTFINDFCNREYDAIISVGEQVAAGLLSLALANINIKAQSLSAWQIPIHVSGEFSNATIKNVAKDNILGLLEKGVVPVITGFQGISENNDIMTIGRGGSDATACAIANAISADECFIYTDVDGVYTADPRIVLKAKRLKNISFDDMILLAENGAKVLQKQSVQIAKQYNVNLRVLSSFTDTGYTKITDNTSYVSNNYDVVGIAHNADVFIIKTKQPVKNDNIINIGDYLYVCPKSLRFCISSCLGVSDFEVDDDVFAITIVSNNGKYIANQYNAKYKYVTKRLVTLFVPYMSGHNVLNELHDIYFANNS